jgi:hypothetical protein
MSVSVVALQPELQHNSGTPSGDDSSLDRTANWLLPASEEMISEEDTASFFTIKFLKM